MSTSRDDFSQVRGYAYSAIFGLLVFLTTNFLAILIIPFSHFYFLRFLITITTLIVGYKAGVKFFKKGLSTPVPPGQRGILETFGKITKKKVPSGNVWLLPFVESLYLVDIQKNLVKIEVTGFSQDSIKMKCEAKILYEVYKPHVYLEKIRDPEDLKKFMEASVSAEINDMMREHYAIDLIKGVDTRASKISERMHKVFENLEPENAREIKEYGIRITGASAKGFDFANLEAQQAYELEGIEERQKKGREVEMEHFRDLAKKFVKESGDSMSFDDALTEVLANYGKTSRTRHEERKVHAVDSSITELVESIINKGVKS